MVDIFCAHCQHFHLDLEGGFAISSSLSLDGGWLCYSHGEKALKKKRCDQGPQHFHFSIVFSCLLVEPTLDDSVGESTGCYSRGSGFDPQYSHGSSQPSITPVPRDLMLSSGLKSALHTHGA